MAGDFGGSREGEDEQLIGQRRSRARERGEAPANDDGRVDETKTRWNKNKAKHAD